MKVFIDTNMIVRSFHLKSVDWNVFLENQGLVPCTVYVPNVVIDESVNKYYQRIEESKNKLLEEHRKLKNDFVSFPKNRTVYEWTKIVHLNS